MKYKGTLVFKATTFRLDVSSSEKIEANPSLNPEGDVSLIKFTPAEEFNGEKSKVIHIDHVTLHMYSKFGHDLSSPLSQGAYFTIDYNKLNAHDDFKCLVTNNSIVIAGKLSFECTVKNVLTQDFKNNTIVLFSSIALRSGSDLLNYTKYGENWELEREEKNKFLKEGDDSFILNRGQID